MKTNSTVDVFRAEPSKLVAACVVEPTCNEDIVAAIKYARDHNHAVTVVGGGHSTLCVRPEAVVVDLRTPAFQKVTVLLEDTHTKNECAPRIEVGGGSSLASVGAALKGTGFSLPLGTYTSVGAGLLLQGGVGYLSREFGLSIDHLEEAEVVDASGKIQFITKEKNRDIFWALCGAGNQIGVVVTKFVFRTVKQEDLFFDRALVSRSPSDMVPYLAKVLEVAISLPRGANLTFFLSKAPALTTDLVIQFIYTCRPEETTDLLNTKFGVDDDPLLLWRETRGIVSYADTAGLMELPPGASKEDFGGAAPFASVHSCFVGGNDDFGTRISDLAKKLVDRMVNAPNPNFRIDFQQTGGAVGDIDPGDTAFWNRKQEYSTVACCLYRQGDAGKQAEEDAYAWVHSVISTYKSAGVAAGTYSVDIMRGKPNTEGYLKDSYGDNWDKVLRVRAVCDPDGMFRPHGV